MSSLDIFIVIVFAYNIIVGLTKGFLKSLFGIGAFILATILAPVFQDRTANLIQSYFNSQQELTKILGLGFSWFFIYIVLNIISSIIIGGMNKTPLKFLDRLAGLFVGIFMSVVIVVLPYLIVTAIPVIKDIPKVKIAISHSVLLPLFEPIATPFKDKVSQALKEQKEEIMKKIENRK